MLQIADDASYLSTAALIHGYETNSYVWQLASCLRSSTTQHQQVGSYRRCRRQVSTDLGNEQVQSVSLCSKCCMCPTPRRTKLAIAQLASRAVFFILHHIVYEPTAADLSTLMVSLFVTQFHCLSHSVTVGSSFLSDGHVRSAVLQKV